jgi:hypothetical protein
MKILYANHPIRLRSPQPCLALPYLLDLNDLRHKGNGVELVAYGFLQMEGANGLTDSRLLILSFRIGFISTGRAGCLCRHHATSDEKIMRSESEARPCTVLCPRVVPQRAVRNTLSFIAAILVAAILQLGSTLA